MSKKYKRFNTELNPTIEQQQKIIQTIGVSRYAYNFYLAECQRVYETEHRFLTAWEFSKWLNNKFIPENPEYKWIKDVSCKSVRQSIMDAEKAFKNFFNHKASYPKFKKKGKSDVKMYFVRTNAKTIIPCERHRIKIPTLGWVQLKEKGYIPTDPERYVIKSGTVSYKAGRYYLSVLVEYEETEKQPLNDFGVGIDLGIKDFAVCSNGNVYKNINKGSRMRKLEKKLKREQRRLSRKYESRKKKGEYAQQNIQKQKLKVQKLYQRIDNVRTDYLNKVISELVKTKPMWITIEDLNVKGMIKNRHLSKAISQQKFFEFRTKLKTKCDEYGIELRIVDRFYPSSKVCHNCGSIKSDLKLSDRTYHCKECGYTADRDYNASLNLRDCETYSIA